MNEFIPLMSFENITLPNISNGKLNFYTKDKILYYQNPFDEKFRYIDKKLFENLISRIPFTPENEKNMTILTTTFKLSEYFKFKKSDYLCTYDQVDMHRSDNVIRDTTYIT
jgi:hypothetical protein